MLYIHGITIYTPYECIDHGVILTKNGQITQVGKAGEFMMPPDAHFIDATGLVLAPGFIDLQINGGFGHDFTADPTAIWPVAAKLPEYGVTSFLPTIITSPLETIAEAQSVLAAGPPEDFTGAIPLGLHVEGPFLNPAKKGAHNPAHLRQPSMADIATWSSDSGIRLVTLAPELPKAHDLIAALSDRGIVVSAGHSMATQAEAEAGFEAGMTYGTHIFNAMPPLHHREPGLPGTLLTHPTAAMGLIPDGLHVHPTIIKMIWRTVGPKRLTLVTDAMAAMGMPDGEYQLGDWSVTVTDGEARLPDGTLAGSTITNDAMLRNLVDFTACSRSEALATLSNTPAQVLGMSAQKGTIAPGYDADLVLLSETLDVVMTIVGGEVIFQNSGPND